MEESTRVKGNRSMIKKKMKERKRRRRRSRQKEENGKNEEVCAALEVEGQAHSKPKTNQQYLVGVHLAATLSNCFI